MRNASIKTTPTTNKSERKIDTIEVGLVTFCGSQYALNEVVRHRPRLSQAFDLKGFCLSELFDSFQLTNNIGEADTKFIVNDYYLTMSNQRAIYEYV